MSTFLFAVGGTRHVEALHQRLGSPAESSGDRCEAVLDRLAPRDVAVLAVAKPNGLVRHGLSAGTLTLGWALDHADRSIRVGARALRAATETDIGVDNREGLFVDIGWSADSVIIRRDVLGHYPVFWTTVTSVVLVSDSALAPRRSRDILGAESHPNPDVIVARSWSKVITNQPLSPDTGCQEIRYLPIGAKLRMAIGDRGATAGVTPVGLRQTLGEPPAADYAEELLHGAREFASGLTSLARAFPDRIRLSLSGGLDSRLVLAAIGIDPAVLAGMDINTGTRVDQETDRGAVMALSEAHGFEVNRPDQPRLTKVKVKLPLGHWALASLGTYDQVIIRTYFWERAMVNLGGHSGEALRGGPGQQRIRSLGGGLERPLRRALHRQIRAGLRAVKVRWTDRDARLLHWLAYRSPFHAGLPVGQGAPFSYRPLNTRRLIALALSDRNPLPYPDKGSASMSTDLLAVLGVDFARTPFAGGARGVTFEQIRHRHRDALRGATLTIADLERYRIIGHPDDLDIGTPTSLLALAGDYSVAGAGHEELIHDRANRSWRRIVDSPFAPAYLPHFETIEMARAGGFPPDRQRRFRDAAGKLLGNDLWTS